MTTTPIRFQLPELWMQLIDKKRLAKLMAIQEVSPFMLARAVGWKSKTSVVRLLAGDYNSVDPDKGARIAKYLGVGVDDLFLTKISSDTGVTAERQSASA